MSLWSSESHIMDNTSNRSADEYIDDALITDSVKKLLSDNSDGNHFDLTADLLTHTSNASHSGVNCGQIGAHSGATVQEGMDLVDALDSLVQHLSRESKALPNDCETIETTVNTITPFNLVFMDHNYCRMDTLVDSDSGTAQPITEESSEQLYVQSSLQKTIIANTATTSPLVQSSSFTSFNDNSYASSSTASATSPAPQTPGSPPMTPSTPPSAAIKSSPKTPTASRRSQRQIDRIEKSVLEKIKAENQEMLKREKEEMESPNKIRTAIEPLDDNKDLDESELVIDLDKKKDNKTNTNQSNNNKKRIKRSKSQTNESTNKKSRMDSKHNFLEKNSEKSGEYLSKCETSGSQKQETSEMDDVIAALKSGVTDSEDNDKTPGIGRQQRTRRKPKRWDDDEVEVDFSGQLGILAEQQKQKQENDENLDQSLDENENNEKVINLEKTEKDIEKNESFDEKKSKENDSQLSTDDDDDESGSDFGSEDDPDKLWCICRTPHNDRFMIGCDSCEEWFHGKCVNVTKQQGRLMEKAGQEWLCPTCIKGISDGISRTELKKLADQKRTKLEAEERIRAQTKRAAKERFLKKEKLRENVKQRERRNSEGKQQKTPQKPFSAEQKASVLAKKVSQMPPKKRELHLRQESEEKEKLKKLIQTSKQKLDKKTEFLAKKKPKEKSSSDLKAKKFPGIEPISKVVPIVRKPEVKKKHKDAIDPSVQDLFKAEPIKKSSVTTPSTPTTPNTPGTTPFSRKPSIDSRRLSTSGPTERQCPSGCGKTVRSEITIYCSQECIETHVRERVKQLRIVRRDKLNAGIKLKEFDDRCVVVEKSSGRILSGKDGIPEKEVLDFIKTSPMFEVMKPPNIRDKKKDDFNSKTLTSPSKSPKRDDKSRTSISRSNSRSEPEGSDQIRSNVKSSLKELLILRCKEVNDMSVSSDDIRKTANKIEEELFKLFKDTSNKYKNKYRSLIFNLKDPKNQGLFRKVVNGKISPERLVQMSAEELASSELAKWREREKITMLEMIKRDAADKVNQVIVKKTHKGEEVIESTIVNESPIEPKLDDLKPTTPTSVPASGVSTFLDDLMGNSNVDTTSQHRIHLFSNNCRICTNKQSDDTKNEVSKRNTAQSSTREESSRPTPKRVRVDPDSANKILLEAAKLSSSSAKKPTVADDDDSHELPTSTVSLSSPEVPTSSSSSRPIWKGSVFMQDVAKFAANAVKVSGTVGDFLSQDISNQVTVIGRIAPEQVLDYVKKLRYSSRTEIGLVKFVSSKEERIGYDAFFDYLDTRKRYGVVGNIGKALKDFYILPLPRNGDVPEVLLPFDGPGLDKKSNRPNLLLGILIRSKGHSKVQTPQNSSTNTSSTKSKTSNIVSITSEFRSYTPPPKTSSNESSPEDSKDAELVSYTPPRTTPNSWKATKTKTTADDDEPYDPEEAELSNSNSLPTTTSTPSIEELMEQIAKSTNPVEMTSTVLSAIAGSSNLELQRRLLEQLTAKVDEQKRQLEAQKAEAEAQSTQSHNSTVIPGLDGQFSASTLKDIKIPENIHDILSTVKQKTQQIEEQQERLRAVAAAGFKFDDPIVKNFGSKTSVNDPIENSPEAEPMDLDEEETPNKSTIIEVNTPAPITTTTESGAQQKSVTDPRLRSKKQTPLPSIAQESGTESQVAAMTPDELMQKAREQIEALAQMQANKEKGSTAATTTNTTAISSNPNNNQMIKNNSNKSQKIKIEWKKRK